MLTAQIIGNVGRDAVMRTVGERQMTVFPVASSRKSRDGQDETTWVDVILHTVPARDSWITRGKRIYASGRISVKTWTDRDGRARPEITLWADRFEFCGGSEDRRSSAAPEVPSVPRRQYAPAMQASGQDDDYDLPL